MNTTCFRKPFGNLLLICFHFPITIVLTVSFLSVTLSNMLLLKFSLTLLPVASASSEVTPLLLLSLSILAGFSWKALNSETPVSRPTIFPFSSDNTLVSRLSRSPSKPRHKDRMFGPGHSISYSLRPLALPLDLWALPLCSFGSINASLRTTSMFPSRIIFSSQTCISCLYSSSAFL